MFYLDVQSVSMVNVVRCTFLSACYFVLAVLTCTRVHCVQSSCDAHSQIGMYQFPSVFTGQNSIGEKHTHSLDIYSVGPSGAG